jgi:ubiquinone/menaquinone biosynthesis C-methylase UbiE
MTDLSYRESQTKLETRIRAHKAFANYDIEEWLDRFLESRRQHAVLDIGCGTGNHLGLYLRHVGDGGRVEGIDREPALIQSATETYRAATGVGVRVASMDERLPFEDECFDRVFSNFAIYNARDIRVTLLEIRRVLRGGGEVVLIGPTRRNAFELYEFNKRLTGTAIDEITLIRTDRIRTEVLPIARAVFGLVQAETINSFLTFPTGEEFIKYFKATMLYEEGAEKLGVTDEQMRGALSASRDIVLSKEMVALICRRAT